MADSKNGWWPSTRSQVQLVAVDGGCVLKAMDDAVLWMWCLVLLRGQCHKSKKGNNNNTKEQKFISAKRGMPAENHERSPVIVPSASLLEHLPRPWNKIHLNYGVWDLRLHFTRGQPKRLKREEHDLLTKWSASGHLGPNSQTHMFKHMRICNNQVQMTTFGHLRIRHTPAPNTWQAHPGRF